MKLLDAPDEIQDIVADWAKHHGVLVSATADIISVPSCSMWSVPWLEQEPTGEVPGVASGIETIQMDFGLFLDGRAVHVGYGPLTQVVAFYQEPLSEA